MAWSLLIRGGSVVDGSGGARPGGRRRGRGRAHRRRGTGVERPGRSRDRRGGQDGLARLHRHALALRPLLLRLPLGGVQDPPGRDDRGRRACARSPRRPLRPDQRDIVRGWAGGIGASLDLRWETFAQYLDALAIGAPSVNIAHFVGHGALRIAAMGFEARPAGSDDMKGMQRLLGEAMDAGAFGFSTGLVYAPSAYSDTQELIALAKSMSVAGRLLLLPHPRRVLDARSTRSTRRSASAKRAASACRSPTSRPPARRTGRRSTPRCACSRRRGPAAWTCSATSIPTTRAAPSSTT